MWGSSLVSCFGVFVLISQCCNKPHVESSFLTRDQAMSLWSQSIDSKALDYQRTIPREYQIVRTHTKETTWIQDLASLNHSCAGQTKQKYKPNLSMQDYHHTQPCPSREHNQPNKQKLSTIITLYKAYSITGPTLGEQKPKGRRNSTLKPVKRRPQTQ